MLFSSRWANNTPPTLANYSFSVILLIKLNKLDELKWAKMAVVKRLMVRILSYKKLPNSETNSEFTPGNGCFQKQGCPKMDGL